MEAEKVLCVVGPTACGKTRMGVLLARRFRGEVVSVDSMQIYRGMAIGTAAPTEDETEGVPHHMVGIADPAESWSAARFVERADGCISDILSRSRLPVLVGGTGLYLDALVAGRTFAPDGVGTGTRAALQRELEAHGIAPLLAELNRVDPESAAKLHAADGKRILRALEVYRDTGKTISEHNRETQARPQKYSAIYIGLNFRDRADLRAAIDARVDAMMAAGLAEEVRALLGSGVPPTATAMQAIGYKELAGAVAGERSLAEAVEEVKLRSRQYAKRQLTWLRHIPDVHWIYWEKERNFVAALQNATEILTAKGLQWNQGGIRPY